MANIHLIGTSHISKESYKSVRASILKRKPNIVAVELDPKRLYALLSKNQKPELGDIKKYGITTYIFARIGSWIQRRLGEKVGLAPGSEIKAAIKAAKKVEAKVYLIDQDIEITLRNISKELTLKEKIKLIITLSFGFFIPTSNKSFKKIDLSKVPEQDLVRELTAEFKKKFPKLYKILVKDRDRYMGRQLIAISKQNPDYKIVAVVGAGHIEGITKILKQNTF
jgi:pheromone shutdown-related protein TraB